MGESGEGLGREGGLSTGMIDKIVSSVEAALADVSDGSTILVGGFGGAGVPEELIDALIAQGAKDLTIVNNNAGNGEVGVAALLKAGRVRKIVCSYPRLADGYVFEGLYRAGKIELELVPQGTLSERMRAAGAGIGAFYTPTGYGTDLAKGKETRVIDGEGQVLEYPLRGDVHHRPGLRDRRARRARSRVHRHAGDFRDARGEGAAQATAARRREGGMSYAKLTREQIAARIAQDIPEGSYVNLGIGMPTLVGNHLPKDREIFLHSENGILGMGPAPAPGREDMDLINAGKEPVTLLTGGAYFHHTDSFAMMRGRHLDIAVLGAFQVSVSGDLANWHTGGDAIPAVGGAMDLAVGAKNVWVMMEHLTKSGESKIVERCTYPLTGVGVVKRVYTDLAVIDITPRGLIASRLVTGFAFDELQRLTGVPLSPSGARAAA